MDPLRLKYGDLIRLRVERGGHKKNILAEIQRQHESSETSTSLTPADIRKLSKIIKKEHWQQWSIKKKTAATPCKKENAKNERRKVKKPITTQSQNDIQVQPQIESHSPIETTPTETQPNTQTQSQIQTPSQVQPQILPQIQTPTHIQSRILPRIESQSPIQTQTETQPKTQTPAQIQNRVLPRIQTPQTETRPRPKPKSQTQTQIEPPQHQSESPTSQEEKYAELINRRVGEGRSKIAIFYEIRLLAKASGELKMLNDASVMKRFNKLINKGEMNAFLEKKKQEEEQERLKKGNFYIFGISYRKSRYQNFYELLLKKELENILSLFFEAFILEINLNFITFKIKKSSIS